MRTRVSMPILPKRCVEYALVAAADNHRVNIGRLTHVRCREADASATLAEFALQRPLPGPEMGNERRTRTKALLKPRGGRNDVKPSSTRRSGDIPQHSFT